MIIDGHAHSGGDFYDVHKLIAVLDELGVDKVVLLPGLKNDGHSHHTPNLAKFFPRQDIMFFMNKVIRMLASNLKPSESMEKKNEYVYHFVQQYPHRIIQFYWADPHDEGVVDELYKKHQQWHFKGVKVHQCCNDFSCDAKALHEVADFAGEKGIPLLIHLYSKEEARKFVGLAQDHPHTQFIVAHLIGLEMMEAHARALKNVYFDISPTPFISQYRIARAVKGFGAERIIFGSDTPYGKDNLKNNLWKVRNMKLSQEQKDLILGGNMGRLLGLNS